MSIGNKKNLATNNNGIFISYRREDAEGYAGRLYDHLVKQFKPNQVFIDIDNIEPGEDFVEAIEQAVTSCKVLTAVIGKYWLTVKDTNDRLRLENPNDYVRLEITAGLNQKIRVIPTLVGGAIMPREDELPIEMAKLARLQAIEFRHKQFQKDIEQLVNTCKRILNS